MKAIKLLFKITGLRGILIIMGSIGFCENFNPEIGFLTQKITAGMSLILISAVGLFLTEYLKWSIIHRKKVKYKKLKRAI